MSKTSNQPFQPGLAFLLSQVGAHAAARFAERIAPLKLKPHHSGILRILENDAGVTQQALCDLLGMFPSRLVGLLDELLKDVADGNTVTERFEQFTTNLTGILASAGHDPAKIAQIKNLMEAHRPRIEEPDVEAPHEARVVDLAPPQPPRQQGEDEAGA